MRSSAPGRGAATVCSSGPAARSSRIRRRARRSDQRTKGPEEVVMRDCRTPPAPDVLLQVQARRIAGQRHQDDLRPLGQPVLRALGGIDAGAVHDQEQEVGRGVGGDEHVLDARLEVGAALVGAVQHRRLPGAASERAEEHLRAVVAGRRHEPGDAAGRPDPRARGIERQLGLVHVQDHCGRFVGRAHHLPPRPFGAYKGARLCPTGVGCLRRIPCWCSKTRTRSALMLRPVCGARYPARSAQVHTACVPAGGGAPRALGTRGQARRRFQSAPASGGSHSGRPAASGRCWEAGGRQPRARRRGSAAQGRHWCWLDMPASLPLAPHLTAAGQTVGARGTSCGRLCRCCLCPLYASTPLCSTSMEHISPGQCGNGDGHKRHEERAPACPVPGRTQHGRGGEWHN